MARRAALGLALAATMLLAASSAPAATRNTRLTDVHRIDQLRALFNASAGRPRLVVVFSPT
jgi:hypothetical protein